MRRENGRGQCEVHAALDLLGESAAHGDGCVFCGVMVAGLQIASGLDGQIKYRTSGYGRVDLN